MVCRCGRVPVGVFSSHFSAPPAHTQVVAERHFVRVLARAASASHVGLVCRDPLDVLRGWLPGLVAAPSDTVVDSTSTSNAAAAAVPTAAPVATAGLYAFADVHAAGLSEPVAGLHRILATSLDLLTVLLRVDAVVRVSRLVPAAAAAAAANTVDGRPRGRGDGSSSDSDDNSAQDFGEDD